jgi:hypothetical protein
MECYHGARYCCVFFQDTPAVPEHADAAERVVRSGPRRKCSVVRIDGQLFRRVVFNGIVTQEIACANK